MSYNPFSKPIGEKLEEDDLQALLSQPVSEGYFVEFKQELPQDRLKIARSIASLANTYGGWYIVGVETDGHNVAKAIDGFSPAAGNHDPISVITESLKVNVDPTPVFHTQVVSLKSGKLVVAVFVPKGQSTPFITRDGRVYRRVHDSSCPVPENSRHALDELIARGRARTKKLKAFARDQRDDMSSRVCAFISPSPHGIVQKLDLHRETEAASLLEESRRVRAFGTTVFPDSITGNLPLNTALVRGDSVLLRQVSTGSDHFYGPSIELDCFGRCRISLPIHRILSEWDDVDSLKTGPCRELIIQKWGECVDIHGHPATHLKYFNIGQTWLALAVLVRFYLDWLKAPPLIDGFDLVTEAMGVSQEWR